MNGHLQKQHNFFQEPVKKNSLFDDVELSWTDTSFETFISTSISDCNTSNQSNGNHSSREGPPDSDSSTERNVTSSKYASKSQLHVDKDAAEVHLQVADAKIQKKIQPDSNDNSNPKSQKVVTVFNTQTTNSSTSPDACHRASKNPMSNLDEAMGEANGT